MQIREAAVGDAKGIARVHVDSWKTAYKGIVSSAYLDGISYEDREKMWISLLDPTQQAKHSFKIVACDNKEIIGFVSGRQSRDTLANLEGEIIGLYLLEHYQGMGIGKRLMKVGAEALHKAGLRSMIIWVLDKNERAIGFYEHLGGRKIGTKDTTIGGCMHTVIGYGWDSIDGLIR